MVPTGADPFSPDNVLVVAAGLLDGTPVIGANRTIMSTISPQTGLMAFSMMGGFFGPELKYAGYDRIVIHGKSSQLVYLWIDNGRVEIRDAGHLRGKGALETIRLVQEDVDEPGAQVMAIGPAGENRVFFASVETERGSCSRGGIGAIMGDKALKAIAVRGTGEINVYRPTELVDIAREVLRFIKHRMENPIKGVDRMQPINAYVGAPQEVRLTDDGWHTDGFSWGNARVRRKNYWNNAIEKQWKEVMGKTVKRLVGCFNCPVGCAGYVSYPGHGDYFLKCFSRLTYLMAAMVDDPHFSFKILARANEYGVDSYSMSQVLAFAVELYEAGILNDEDMGAFPSGVEERFFWLMERIVKREGIGDVLADGVYWAARRIGKGAEAYDHNTVKKHEQAPIKLGMLNPLYFLMFATGEKINITQIEGQVPQVFLTTEEKEDFIKDWVQLPNRYADRIKEWLLKWEPRGEYAYPFWPPVDTVCALVDWQETMHYIDDALGLCAGLSSFAYKPPYHIHNLPLVIYRAAGVELDEDGLWEVALRNRTLIRAINVRRGLKRADDRPPDDHWAKRFPEYEARLLDEYYRFRGWNKDGIPTTDTLDRLGLDYIREDQVLQRNLE
jgi:aldehyde:ferredoxin oxidoreductase